ncbi:MAG: DUF2752 domain-containing protein [Sedimentisphaerales bacterium]|nr:DUF2752 domain-containing protein [Sedimentisphaerales bacterium]
MAISGLFYFLHLGAVGKIDMARVLGICEFKRTYGLPCVSCWMTTSAMAFVRGDILEAFYIQPAGAIICCGLVCAAVFSLLIAVFAVNFRFLHQPLSRRFIRYFVISTLIILAAGWAVTIARAIAQGRIS